MVPEWSLLETLVRFVDRIPLPPAPPRGRGRPKVYPDRLFLKALVIMIVRHLSQVHTFLTVVEQPTPQMRRLRRLLMEGDRYPARRTFERRLRALPETLPAQIACLGQQLVQLLRPWGEGSPLAAIDSTVLSARGGVWHQKHRAAGEVPHTSIDTEAHWTKSGWHGWVYGWKLHLVTTVAEVWIPLAAVLTPANAADNAEAPALLERLPAEVRYIVADTAYQDSALSDACWAKGRILITSKRGTYPHADEGVEVRRIFHQLRSHAIENLNGQFKAIFDCLGQVPTRGLVATQRFALGAVVVYQLTLLYRFETGGDLRAGLKPLLKAA